MPRPYPDDLRMCAVEKVLAGESRCSVAKQIGVAVSTVIKWVQLYLETGSVSPRRMGGYRKRKLEGRQIWILERIKDCPAITLAGLQGLLRELDVSASVAAIWRFLRSCGLTRKKPAPAADERNRPDVERRRKRWKRYQDKADSRKLVFIDETWTKTNMSPRFGWGPKGERVHGWAPFGHWGTSTFIAALRHDRIDAPWVLDGPADGDAFLLYVETQLVPTLSRGDIVIMDNLGSHKTRAVRAAIRDAGTHLLFLPPCSPDLNPIEQVFAKLKHFLRKDQPRTRGDLWKNIGLILKRFEPEECANYLANSGYGVLQTKRKTL